MLNSNRGLIQGVSDNFDVHIFTQNGLKQTHYLPFVQPKANARNQSSYKNQGKSHLQTIDSSTILIAMCGIEATSHQAG